MKMTDAPLLGTAEQINRLAYALARYNCIAKFDRTGEPEAGVLEHTFSDLERSFRTFLYELLPTLAAGNLPEQETQELLLRIGEELRHIQYHIMDPHFYRYLRDDS